MTYVFSEELFEKEYGKPKGKGTWTFGDRNKTFLLSYGSEEDPITYRQAQKEACAALEKMRYPMYKTIYLHP